jgi:hypothetical protein
MAWRFWLPSGLLIVIVNGLNPPAWKLVVPAVSDGLNGNGLAHGTPFGPETTLNVELESTGTTLEDGTIDAVVV